MSLDDNFSGLTSKLPPKLIFASAGLFLFFLCAGGALLVLLLSTPADSDYPDGIVVEGLGRCGTSTWLQRGRSVRIERYRCVETTNTINEVFAWHIRNGYTPVNGGLLQRDIGEGFIPIINIKRIYLIDQKDGTTMVRIYDDTTVRAP